MQANPPALLQLSSHRSSSLCVPCHVIPSRPVGPDYRPSAVRNPQSAIALIFSLVRRIAMLGRMLAVAGAVSHPTVPPARQDALNEPLFKGVTCTYFAP